MVEKYSEESLVNMVLNVYKKTQGLLGTGRRGEGIRMWGERQIIYTYRYSVAARMIPALT